MIRLKYSGKDIPDFPALLNAYPPSQFSSPRRSTVPLLAYWRDSATRCDAFLRHLQLQASGSLDLAFEYEVPVQKGDGRPSCTDLMISGDGLVVAVEGKYREPAYKTVKKWLGDPASENRNLVLQGWLDLINRATGSHLSPPEVAGITYQAIHRTASACYPHSGKSGIARIMVYQCFADPACPKTRTDEDLKALRRLIPAESLRLARLIFRLEKKPDYKALEVRWDRGKERDLKAEVREGLLQDALFGFGEPELLLL